ncbi:putative ABC-type transport system involved in lysophospholipase L1 biosynthesis, ATPase component [Polynucleobacter duraquae]|jgi:putative ABC transport system ATP-binding protein|uniref:ABC-type transport system involved in lysophospholipase L1 biosynthesis, ATPase component n=1 Tax=Polynucleobacter duraquae TaxID=1835254 RepID=A0A0E3ZLV5_9BURK|nr:ATP-binding cassette domain-containing protein [Polynucleobacter duraquae]AKD25377.1 putative ABC-type transport system involved in lysophospholipase L1 biosynthesis, ATPase component [Polynucleobacter duraquae]
MNRQSNSIVADQVSKLVKTADGNLSILHELSFQIKQGESVAIVGASGSGKSTLLSLLAGLDLPSAGQIELMGQNLNLLDEDGRARLRGQLVGFVFQSFQLLPHLTALENVMLPLEIAGDPQADARLSALEWLEKVGLTPRANHFPKTLSGGEQQRVALARAFINKPAILFADEPTGSLDEASGNRVIELLFELNRENSSTLVLVTHDPALAARCGRQLSLHGGRLT